MIQLVVFSVIAPYKQYAMNSKKFSKYITELKIDTLSVKYIYRVLQKERKKVAALFAIKLY